jgi:hypothetical protein
MSAKTKAPLLASTQMWQPNPNYSGATSSCILLFWTNLDGLGRRISNYPTNSVTKQGKLDTNRSVMW